MKLISTQNQKFFFSLFFLLSFFISSQAQDTVVTFYRDFSMEQIAPEKRAKVKLVQITNGNTKTEQIYNVKSQCLVYQEEYTNELPSGFWIHNTTDCQNIDSWNFGKLNYNPLYLDSMYSNLESANRYDNFEKAYYGADSTGVYFYIGSNLRYPPVAKENGITGKVYVQFIIKASGETQVTSILKGAHPFLDLEAWNLIEQMPNWTPAKKDGVPVDSYSIVTMNFNLR